MGHGDRQVTSLPLGMRLVTLRLTRVTFARLWLRRHWAPFDLATTVFTALAMEADPLSADDGGGAFRGGRHTRAGPDFTDQFGAAVLTSG